MKTRYHENKIEMLKLRVPPIFVVILIGIIMWITASQFPLFTYELPFRWIIGLSFPIVGCIVIGYCGIVFRKSNTTVNPTSPDATSALVTSGIYSVTRNPMYVSMLLFLVGWAYVLSNILSLVIVPAFILYMNQFQIKPEEEVLESKFGKEFLDYKSKVRRWL